MDFKRTSRAGLSVRECDEDSPASELEGHRVLDTAPRGVVELSTSAASDPWLSGTTSRQGSFRPRRS